MIVSLRGKRVAVSSRRLALAAAMVLMGLGVTFAALTHEGGPAGFFDMKRTTHKLAVAVGLESDTPVLLAEAEKEGPRRARGPFRQGDDPGEKHWHDELKRTTENKDGKVVVSNVEGAGAWSSWYYFAPTILLGLIAAAAALVVALKFFKDVKAAEPGTPKMVEIMDAVAEGAMAYLKAQRKRVLPVLGAASVIILAINLIGMPWWLAIFVPLGLFTGGFSSFITGWYGMKTATMANARTAYACKQGGLNAGLQVAFKAGSVMGLSVVGIGIGFITVWLLILGGILDPIAGSITLNDIANAMITFGLGASLVALFARVGGGIYTKAADVGADLVGKVEAGIPEDDPRNPATIADNVGDNVGDVAGMGADLYESYLGSVLACIALAWSASQALGHNPWGYVAAPMWIAAGGIILSIIGTKFVKTKEGANLGELLKALKKGVNVASIAVVPLSLVVCLLCFGVAMGLTMWLACCIGLASGLVIAWGSEKYTSYDDKPTQDVAKQALTGPATVIIGGLAVGMMSTWIPIITVAVATFLAFGLGGGFLGGGFSAGVYAVSLAAVGMLSTLGITLATDAYGPIADNAGGNAEMAGLPPEVREKTDALDSLGNTTAAIGKGFAIGSAALTALGLIAAYSDSLSSLATYMDVSPRFSLGVITPEVIIGLFVGALLVFVFCALTMKAVGDAAKEMVEEVRRQFREIVGLREGKEGVKPEHGKCVEISTQAAIRRMMLPAIIAVVGPIATGVFFGAGAVFGLLAGGLATGFAMAVMMANTGGSWDNAKKFIEKGGLAELMIADGKYKPEVEDPQLEAAKATQGGPDDAPAAAAPAPAAEAPKKKKYARYMKGSNEHKAAVVGDTVGDPFKDTSGPSLNILIKLMSMVAVATAALTLLVNDGGGLLSQAFRFIFTTTAK
ncbi:MAG: sodium-translocating pyrophosphatase [Planctomycetes bacterium]|nr:sodium-translocating pyrophosphatase [Planctomycetota bacterium]